MKDESFEFIDTLKIDSLITLANKTSWTDIKSSENYSQIALKLSQLANYEKGLAYSKYNLAKIFSNFEFDLSEGLALESLEHAKAINDSILIADIFNVLGNLKSNINQSEEALLYCNKSLVIYLEHNQDSAVASIYNNLGLLNASLNTGNSIGYFIKAAEINKKTKNHLWLAINHLNMGDGLINTGKLEEGLKQLQKSLNIVEEYNYNRLYSWLYNSLSQYYLKIEKVSRID